MMSREIITKKVRRRGCMLFAVYLKNMVLQMCIRDSMITVKPIEDNIRKEQLLSKYHCSADDSTILVMKDGVCELGYAAIDLIQGKLLIRNIFLTNGSVQELSLIHIFL